MRKIYNLNQDWRFIRRDEAGAANVLFADGGWEPVSIPHTWNAIDGANGFDYYKGACWYRRSFRLPAAQAGKRVFIEFQGAHSVTDVYVNGEHLGQHRGGFSTFRFDISGVVKAEGDNLLAVKVDNTIFDDVYPQKADFTFYGGIYRDVNLIVAENVHFDLMDYGSQGVYIVQENVTAAQASLTVRTRLVNENEAAAQVRLWLEILDATGRSVTYAARDVAIAGGETLVIELPVTIDKPILWHGRRNPYLYQAVASIVNFNDTQDELRIPVGVRYFRVDPENGFFLNGEHLALNGVSRHQDRMDMGWAITRQEHREDMDLIKEVGATSIRLAHYQHDQYFYDLCDQEGMVVWAEIPFISVMSTTELEGINPKLQMTELIRQNFNHPSICFWGVQNEIQIGGERPEVRRLVKELHALAKQEDPTRLTTLANVLFVSDTDEYNYMTDIVGYNKYYGWYVGQAEEFAGWLDSYHKTNPQVSVGISEYGAEGIIRYHTDTPVVKDYTEEYHALYHEIVWKIFAARPFLWSTYCWNMFDFGANIRDEGGVKGRNNKGLVTYDRKIRKDAFYMYKAHWSAEPFVHIAGKRYIARPGSTAAIKVYTNCNSATLLVNGQAFASQDGDPVLVFADVPLQAGWNEIKAVAQANGQTIEDTARFNAVSEPNPGYTAPEEEAGSAVANWFEMPEELADISVEEIQITDDVYSTRDSFAKIMETPEGEAILVKYLSNTMESPMFGMMKTMSIDLVATMYPKVFTERVLFILNRELTRIKKA